MLLCFFGTLLANTELLLVLQIRKPTTILPSLNISRNDVLIHLFNSQVWPSVDQESIKCQLSIDQNVDRVSIEMSI